MTPQDEVMLMVRNLTRLNALQEAERQGLVSATISDRHLVYSCRDAEVQAAYERGFALGRAILAKGGS